MKLCEQDMKNGNAGGAGNNSQAKHDSNRKLTCFLFLSIMSVDLQVLALLEITVNH